MANRVTPPLAPTTPSTDFELFFRMSADVMLVATLDGTIIDFNNAYSRISGYSRDEIIDLKGGWDFVLPEDIPNALKVIDELRINKTQLLNYELRIRTKSGQIKTLSYDASVNSITGHIYCIGRDVTTMYQQQKHAAETESRLRFFFDHALDGMSIIVNGEYQLVNNAFLRIFGAESEADIIGRNFLDFVDPEYKEKVGRIVQTNSDEMYTSRIIRLDNGLARNVEVTGKTISHQDQKVRISVVRDLDERRNMQEKVKESEARFTAVFQNASLGIALTDRNGKFVEANYTLLQRLGYTLDEIKGLDIYQFLEANDHSSTKNYFKQLLSGKTSTAFFERRWQRKNGSSTWSKMTCNVLQGTQGKTLILSIIEDIDLQKRNEQALMESEEKFRAVYESSPMGIVITSDGGRIHDVNDAFVNMLGYTEAALHSKNLLDFTHPADKDAAQVQLLNIYSGAAKHYSVEKRFLRKDGTEFWAREAMSSLFHVGDAMYTVAIIENIEGRKRAEAALEQKNLELTHTNQELEHFAYVASHDLQEPLRTITSFIQILERRYHDKLDIEAQQFMGFIVDGAKRMQTLIHDLLEYSRINRYNTGFEKIDLNEIFITVNHVLKDKIETHEALIMAEHLPEVYGNRIQLTQVFQNLIDNAIKFKSDKRTPEVTISVIEHKTTWELIFKDNGIGISAEYFQRIFVIFQRLHTVEEYTGTGIGLAICRKIVERHGGEIWVESKPGKGSTFHLTLSKKLSAG